MSKKIEIDGMRYDLTCKDIREFAEEYAQSRYDREDIADFIGLAFVKEIWADEDDCEFVKVYGVHTSVRIKEVADSQNLWKQIMKTNASSILDCFSRELARNIEICLSDRTVDDATIGNVYVRAIWEE